jgi:glycosyltransferase involved in cell wall biosynthesis
MNDILLIGGIAGDKPIIGGETGKNANLIATLRDCGRTVIPVSLLQLQQHPWRGVAAVCKLMMHPKANVIISSSLKRSGWLIKLLHNTKSKRNICYVGTGCEFSGKIARGEFGAEYFKNVNSIIVQGESMKKELATVGLDALVLPNFKQMDYLPKLPERARDGVVKFAFMSRMNEKKGVNMIIDCAKKLNQYGLDSKFCVNFYGAFEDKAYQEEIMKSISNMPNVKYKGILNLREHVGYDTLAEHTVMLFPTFWPGEGFPGVLIDAMMAGLPVIASDWHFNPDIVDEGKTGIIIPNQNKKALYLVMKDVIENPQKYLGMAKYCQQKAKEYDTKNVINEDFLSIIKM